MDLGIAYCNVQHVNWLLCQKTTKEISYKDQISAYRFVYVPLLTCGCEIWTLRTKQASSTGWLGI